MCECARLPIQLARNDRVCCERCAGMFRHMPRTDPRANVALGYRLRGETSRHCINLLSGQT